MDRTELKAAEGRERKELMAEEGGIAKGSVDDGGWIDSITS